MSIVSLKKRARAGTLEVEHLLKEAAYPNDALAKALDELSVELQWSGYSRNDDENSTVPLAIWAKVVSTYCRDGFYGLRQLSEEQILSHFVIGLLEELKTEEALDTLLLAFNEDLNDPCRDIGTSFRIASAVNLMLSFKPVAAADSAQTIELVQHPTNRFNNYLVAGTAAVIR